VPSKRTVFIRRPHVAPPGSDCLQRDQAKPFGASGCEVFDDILFRSGISHSPGFCFGDRLAGQPSSSRRAEIAALQSAVIKTGNAADIPCRSS